ncbi:MAG: hypothetical protein RL140_525 [Actinomycetota bacterium]|jgi:ABC-type spermidine/putrescine transport system permease subunit II
MDTYQTAFAVTIIVFVLIALVSLAIILVCAHFVGRAARMKNRSYASFFWLSVLVGPIITGFAVALLPFNLDDPRHPKNKAAASGLLSFTNK